MKKPVWCMSGVVLGVVVLCFACRIDSSTEAEPVTWTVTADGENDTTSSTKLIFTFTEGLTALSAEDITLTDDTGVVRKGTLTGEGHTWALGITVEIPGEVQVKISREGVEGTEKTLRVYKKVDITYTAAADGNDTTGSTKIIFSGFSETVEDLTADAIILTDHTDFVTKGELSKTPTGWELGITVKTAGNVKVKISKEGIDPTEKPVTLYKAGEQVTIDYEVRADGGDTAGSTALTFTFGASLTALRGEEISLTNGTGVVTKGDLTGEGQTWALGITVQTPGEVQVKIHKAGVEGMEKTLTVYKKGDSTYTVAANGENNRTDSTTITITFNEAITGLTREEMSLTNGTGVVTKGALTGEGQTWVLGITVETPGEVQVKISKAGIEGTEKRVTVHKGPVLTAAILFASEEYGSGTEFDTDGWSGQESAEEGWTLRATEQNRVYFGVYKEAAQSITVSGEDGGKVSQASKGVVVDGITAGEELAVFTVNTGDLVFDGGIRRFTLNVSEDGKESRRVTVTLNIPPALTGAAVFRLVERVDGVDYLERVGGDYTNFNGFLAAFEWLEENAEANREYTIRVEKDEGIPRLAVSLNNAENATLRLRGTKNGPFTLKYDDSIKGKTPIDKGGIGTSNWSFIQIGPVAYNYDKSIKKTFILGHNITLEGMPVTSKTDYCVLLEVGWYATLVLEPGSTITKFDSTYNHTKAGPIYIASFASPGRLGPEYHGVLRIEGGAITECTFLSQTYLIFFSTDASWLTENSFTLKPDSGLVLEGNTANSLGAYGQGSSPNPVLDLRDYLTGGLVIPPFPAAE